MYVFIESEIDFGLFGNIDNIKIKPCINIKLPDGSVQMVWNASTADLLAEDWTIWFEIDKID